ncbi:leucine-rich repeat domain-containing protein [Pseudochryseolinea flava]|nr:leucine-rich repeat domain-containing protein [Pseudochryseolinea flava]
MSTSLHAQSPNRYKPATVAIYKTTQDSVQLAHLDRLLEMAYQKTRPQLDYIDSLEKARTIFARQAILKMKRLYYADENKTPIDSLFLINDLSRVTAVSIEGKKLKSLPRILSHCKNLQQLEIVNCSLRKIQRLPSLRKLTTVSILNNSSQKRVLFGKNKTISSFTIHGENTRSHPSRFRNLSSLKTLDLSECALTEFPRDISQNKKLEELILQHNAITLEKDMLPKLKSLKRLGLQHNNIARFQLQFQTSHR